MMKVLILNPYYDTEHELIQHAQKKNMAVVLANSKEEAHQLLALHKNSIDLLFVHRENERGEGQQGIEFLLELRVQPEGVSGDLPVILSSEVWTEAECADHQETDKGANAYLRFPLAPDTFVNTVFAVLGEELSQGVAIPPPPPPPPGVTREEDLSSMLEPPKGLDNWELSRVAELPPPLPRLPGDEENSIINLPAAPLLDSGDSRIELNLEAASGSFDDEYEVDEASQYGEGDETPVLLPPMPSQLDAVLSPPPVEDAIVPGGAAQTPDVKILKKYLLLREQDVSTLSAQLKKSRDQVASIQKALRVECAKNEELEFKNKEQNSTIQNFESEKLEIQERLEREIEELRFQLREKSDRAKILSKKVKETLEERELVKERVRADLRTIRGRERELENRLEIVQKDSEALLVSRQNKIIELKRKLDLLEFNIDLIQEQYEREKTTAKLLKEKLTKASRAMKVAGGMLEIDETGWTRESFEAETNQQSDSTQAIELADFPSKKQVS